jgi:hypothetical protein
MGRYHTKVFLGLPGNLGSDSRVGILKQMSNPGILESQDLRRG